MDGRFNNSREDDTGNRSISSHASGASSVEEKSDDVPSHILQGEVGAQAILVQRDILIFFWSASKDNYSP